MNAQLISLLLWIPFCVLVLIYGLIYGIAGYRKGLWRALVSVGATVVSGVVSALIAKAVSPSVSKALYETFASQQPVDSSGYEEIVEMVAVGVLQSLIALLIFSSILFVLTIILKAIAARLVKDKFEPSGKGMKFAGLAVRLVEAVVFVLLLLLPIYGTLSVYLPIISEITAAESGVDDSGEGDEIKAVVGAVVDHPLMKAVKIKPFTAIYNGLADSSVGDTDLNVPKMVGAVSGVMEKLSALEGMSEAEQKQAITDLIEYIDKNFVGEKWFYSVYDLARSELVKQYDVSSSGLSDEEKKFADEFIKSLEISEKDFQTCAEKGLDLAHYVIEKDLLTRMEAEELSVLYYDEFLYKLGETLNCNESMLAFKKIMIMPALNEFTGSADASLKLFSANPLKLHTDKESQKQEAGAVLLLLKGVKKLIIAEGLVRHPDFGYDAIAGYITTYDFASLVYHSYEEDDSNPVTKYLNENPSVVTELMSVLKEYASRPISADYFDEYAEAKVREAVKDLDLGGASFSGDSFTASVPGGNGDSFTVVVPGGTVVGGNGGIYSAVIG